jgi:delta(3,5)-delta(2,4)-dienoyl-CoA isomerase
VHGVASGLALGALYVVDVGRAAADTTFRINGWTLGGRADQGTLARASKLGGNASLLHELAFSARAFGAENTLRSLGLVSRIVPGRACWLSLRKSSRGSAPLPLLGLNRC